MCFKIYLSCGRSSTGSSVGIEGGHVIAMMASFPASKQSISESIHFPVSSIEASWPLCVI